MNKRSAAGEREQLRQWNRGEPIAGEAAPAPVQLSLDDAALAFDAPLGPLEQERIGGIGGASCGWRPALGECSLVASSECSLTCMLERRRGLAGAGRRGKQ